MVLKFKDGTSASCETLGCTTVDGSKYAVFFETATKYVYVYKFEQKKSKFRLYPVVDAAEFRRVCTHLNSLIK
jgi:hypothetical protein